MQTSSQTRIKIEHQWGFFPPFFNPAIQTPQVLENLWQQTLSAYLDNPLPSLFKEKLFAYLSQFCSVPYFLICHCCVLRSLGMTAAEILKFIQSPPPAHEQELRSELNAISQQPNELEYWYNNPAIEYSLLRCSMLLFLRPDLAESCRIQLRQSLGMSTYSHLVAFLGYIKFCHQWVESNPEISYESDRRAQLHLAPLVLEELDLAEFFQNHRHHYPSAQPQLQAAILESDRHKLDSITADHQDCNFTKSKEASPLQGDVSSTHTDNLINSIELSVKNRDDAINKTCKDLIERCKERFRNCFINAPFPMIVHSSDGEIFNINQSWSELTGYTLKEIPTIANWREQAAVQSQDIIKTKGVRVETETAFQKVVYSLLDLPCDLQIQIDSSEAIVTTRSEVKITTRNGERRIWDFYSAPIAKFPNGTELMISMAKDITHCMRAEAALVELKSKLQLVLETAQIGSWDWHIPSNTVHLCDRAQTILGKNKKDPLDTYESFLRCIHPQESQLVDLVLNKAIANRKDINLKYRVICPNGKVRWVGMKGKLIYDEWGYPIRIAGVVVEISKQSVKEAKTNCLNQSSTQDLSKRAEELERLLNHIPSYIFAVDCQTMRISFCNQMFAKGMGFKDPDRAIGKTVYECFSPNDAERIIKQHQKVIETGESWHQVEKIALFNGYCQLDTMKIPLKNRHGEVSTILSSSYAIPELIETKQALSERTVQLEVANQELESFSYSVSHDLQAPLRVINGFSQVLLERFADRMDDRGHYYLRRIRTNSERMGELIEDLLKLSRITRSQIKRTNVNLSAIVKEIATELSSNQSDRIVEFAIVPGLIANGDNHLLKIVLYNLLENAWKYTSKHPRGRIEFGAICECQEKLVYYVKDNGAGFDMAYADKLFEAFQRLHSETDFPGTGVGLATVKRIIHKHGGQVWAEGNIAKGATFYFTL